MKSQVNSLTGSNPQPPSYGRALLKSHVVMHKLGYSDRSAFWQFVHQSGLPHVRLNSRTIRFDEQQLNDWLARRSTNGGSR